MKATVEISDTLFRRAKAEAALRGRKFRDLVEEGLIRVLDAPETSIQPPDDLPTLHALMKTTCGMVDSGVSDLATNPDHMRGFGLAQTSDRCFGTAGRVLRPSRTPSSLGGFLNRYASAPAAYK